MTDVHGDAGLERADVLASLATQRSFLRQTLKGLDDAQIALRPTVSDLCLGGIVKHVAAVEKGWVDFMLHGPAAIGPMDEAAREQHAAGFRLTTADTIASLLATYVEVAASTEDAVRSIASLDDSHLLPEAPWFPKGTRWSARRVLLHVATETAHHCGHADIIREAIDGSKTMG